MFVVVAQAKLAIVVVKKQILKFRRRSNIKGLESSGREKYDARLASAATRRPGRYLKIVCSLDAVHRQGAWCSIGSAETRFISMVDGTGRARENVSHGEHGFGSVENCTECSKVHTCWKDSAAW